MTTYTTNSRDETIALGERLAGELKAGDLLALVGDLGSGKTTFVKGVAKGLGITSYRYVNSPTFVLIKEYHGRVPIYHFDVYRLDSACGLDSLGLEEYFYGNGVCLVEWADKIPDRLPVKYLKVEFTTLDNDRRSITVTQKE
ncbi:MAG: tRNA (adenosine(37)-N6)-threonylcarbamoyltransferase complex ATPase subunit type 1 TsaE [Candidatus Omnitrophota bacterium]